MGGLRLAVLPKCPWAEPRSDFSHRRHTPNRKGPRLRAAARARVEVRGHHPTEDDQDRRVVASSAALGRPQPSTPNSALSQRRRARGRSLSSEPRGSGHRSCLQGLLGSGCQTSRAAKPPARRTEQPGPRPRSPRPTATLRTGLWHKAWSTRLASPLRGLLSPGDSGASGRQGPAATSGGVSHGNSCDSHPPEPPQSCRSKTCDLSGCQLAHTKAPAGTL